MAGGPFDIDLTGSSLPSSLPTSPPPPQAAFSRPGTGPRPTPAPQSGGTGASGGIPGLPTNDEIEAKIQAAMSSALSSRPSSNPLRDTRTQLFVGNLPYRVRWQDLKDLFRRSGTVLRADVSLGPDNRSRGYGTVLLATAEDAGRAIDMFNGYVWQTRTLEVRPDKMGIGGGVGMGSGTGMNMGMSTGIGFGMGAESTGGYAVGVGGFSTALGVGGAGLGSFSGLGAGPNGISAPFGNVVAAVAGTSRLSGASPFLSSAGEDPVGVGAGGRLTPGLAAQLARVASPGAASVSAVSLNSPLPASPVATSGGISLNSPGSLHVQLAGAAIAVGAGERSRNLFVGNLPFHVQWQDLKDLFRQAGTILRADVALGPEGRSRGFGTVSFANEADAERAVRMFNGYDYNGRQLKVHYDKFTASSASAVPMAGISSMSAPQSPHPQLFVPQHAALSHAASLAHQVLVQQQQREDQLRQEQQFDHYSAPLASHRTHTDQYPFYAQLLSEDMSRLNASLDTLPGSLSRAHSDSVQQMLYTQQMQAQTMPVAQSSRRSDSQNNVSPTHTLQQQHAPLHISLPSYHEAYPPFDFSPGSPYGYDLYNSSMKTAFQGGIGIGTSLMNNAPERDAGQPGGAVEALREGSVQQVLQESVSASAQSSTSPPSHRLSEPRRPSNQTNSNPESGQSSTQSSQPVTQATSPTVASPASAHSGSLHSHPAHPGPIALPPPAAAFAMPPAMSPVYHPQMSPYASPLHHPVMMGVGVAMTPFGLPPITPSMPSFQFVPQPSPGPAPSSGSVDLLSPTGPSQGMPTPNGSLDPQLQYPAHLRHPHGPMLSPYAPFSPGVAMSPGAFWGRPGSGGVNPYINPAVGAPVHAQTGYFPPLPARSQTMEEPQGYFPPFVPASSSGTTSRPSGLANEITHDSASANGSADAGECGSGSEQGVQPSHVAQDASTLVDRCEARKRPDSAVSEGTTAGTGTFTGTETSPRPASSTGTSWQTDSADPSPSKGAEVELRMQSLVLSGDDSKDLTQGGARSAASCMDKVHALSPADSRPTQSSASLSQAKAEVDAISQMEWVANGVSLSDPVASR